MAELHVFKNSTDWVIAKSIDDAWAVWAENSGERRADYEMEDPFKQLDDLAPVTINYECWEDALADIPVDSTATIENLAKITRTATEWCGIIGRGFLCSTEF